MNELFFRAIGVRPENIDTENRTVTVSFSSEHPVNRRYFGQEVLLHGESNVDFEYLNTVGSVLRKHGGDMADIVGSVERSWIDGRRGMAVIKFDDDENGNTAMRKIQSGSLRGISAGYMIEKGIRLDEESDVWIDPETKREYKGPAIIATKWRPHEITLTPIPADHTVGFGRSLVDNIDLQTIRKEDQMNENEIRELVKNAVADAVANMQKPMTAEELAASVRSILKDETTPKIQVDRDTLSDLSSRASAVSDACKSKIFDMALEGRSHIEMLTFISDEAVKNPDAIRRQSAGDDQHDPKGGDRQYRKIDDIPDELFSGAFRS